MSEQIGPILTVKNYLDGLEKTKMLGSRCKKCGALMIPLKPICNKCGSFDLEEIESKGEGVIRSFTIIHFASPNLADKVPYAVAIISLDEGPSIMGRLVGIDSNKPEEIAIGTRVKFEIIKENEKTVVAFRPISVARHVILT